MGMADAVARATAQERRTALWALAACTALVLMVGGVPEAWGSSHTTVRANDALLRGFEAIAARFSTLLTWVRNLLILAVVAAAVWNLGTWLKGRPNLPGLITVIVTGVMLGGVQGIISFVLDTGNAKVGTEAGTINSVVPGM